MNSIKKGRAGLFLLAVVSCLNSAAAADLRKLYDPVIRKVARAHSIDPELVHVIIRAESNYDVFAISDKGAMGLMQLMPATAMQYGVKNVFDPAQNIEGGVRYIKDLVKLFRDPKKQTQLVLAAYNAGQEAVKKYKGIPPYPETKAYIAGIMRNYKKPTIRTTNPVYKGFDASGQFILTTDPSLIRVKKD